MHQIPYINGTGLNELTNYTYSYSVIVKLKSAKQSCKKFYRKLDLLILKLVVGVT